MTNHTLNKFVHLAFAVLLGIASTADGSVPSMQVTVFDASGKAAFKGATSANATFATDNLPSGNYIVQFNAKSAPVRGNQYLLVVAAGKTKVVANAVPGEKFTAGGVAMKVNVRRGSKLTGQIASEQSETPEGRSKVKVVNGTRFVWVEAQAGSNLKGWVEEGSPNARNIVRLNSGFLRKVQDRAGEGSMISDKHVHAHNGH